METRDGAPPGYLTSDEVADILGVPYRSLMRWVEERAVTPFAATKRSRSPRLWGEMHLREARVIKTLRDEGISLPAVRKAMDTIRTHDECPIAHGYTLALSREADVIWIHIDGQSINREQYRGQRTLLFVNLEEAAKEQRLP